MTLYTGWVKVHATQQGFSHFFNSGSD